jgi:hypothetical protein
MGAGGQGEALAASSAQPVPVVLGSGGDASVTDPLQPAIGDGGAQLTLSAGGTAVVGRPEQGKQGGAGPLQIRQGPKRQSHPWGTRALWWEEQERLRQGVTSTGGGAALALSAGGASTVAARSGDIAKGGHGLALGAHGSATTEPWLSDEELLAIVMAA